MSNSLGGDTVTRKYIIWSLKYCPVPSTSCDLYSYKVWSCYVKRFRSRCIYKKIQYLTFDIDLGVKVIRNFAQYPLHHVTYSATKFEVATSNRLGYTFTRKYIILTVDLYLGVKVTRNVAQYPLHHVTYSTTKFEVATYGLGGDTFTRNVTDGQTADRLTLTRNLYTLFFWRKKRYNKSYNNDTGEWHYSQRTYNLAKTDGWGKNSCLPERLPFGGWVFLSVFLIFLQPYREGNKAGFLDSFNCIGIR